MTVLPSLGFSLLLLTVALLSITTLRLAAKVRHQKVVLDQLSDELRATRQEAEQQRTNLVQRSNLDTIKDEFISNVSHELRTPLTSIRGALGLLSAGVLGTVDVKAHNLLRIASTNTERLIRLINDILDLQRMDAGRASLNLRRCSIYDLAREALDTMTPMADAAEVRLDLTCYAPRDSIYFDADPDRILQVITNLLSNAIKFSTSSSTVSVQIDADPDSVLLKVVDRGRGIPPEQLESIFDRFQQVESSDASKKGGTGLGLAICRSIVQQHGGAIWAQLNVAAPGTTLWVQFSRSARASDSVVPALPVSTSRPGRGLILVCDDDPGVRTVVAEQLRQHGYSILEARSGEEGVSLAIRHAQRVSNPPIDAVLLDLCLPGLSGLETVQQLRRFPHTAEIPVVILSVLPPKELSNEQLKPGLQTHGWVQKPFSENQLLAELERVLQSTKVSRQAEVSQILFVEDDKDLASIVINGFEASGLNVAHATTRQQAMDRCLISSPDLLILDLTLPDGDGFSFVEWLRRQPALRALPMIVYSGREVSEPERAKLQLGRTQFVTKASVQPQEVERMAFAMLQDLRDHPSAQVA